MKRIFFFAASALALASCSTEGLVDDWFGNSGKEGPISFNMGQKNMVRSVSNMQDVDHYNFGVFAYKSTETVNEIMGNYLVGYNGDNVGYYMTAGNQTTLGDKEGVADGESMWQYEKLGNAEYNYAGEGFYRAEQTEFMSNVDYQYLRYWDLAAASTSFYAYAPYINGANTVTYVDGTAQAATGADTYVMTFPNGMLKTAKNNPELNEAMYATTKVEKANYGHDVSLNFKRLNAKVNIKFWEDIPGYSVRILDLKEGTYEGVQATPAIHESNDVAGTHTYGPYGYRLGQYYLSNGAKIQFPAETVHQFEGELSTTAGVATPLVFAAPTASAIGETRFEASKSDDTYYVVPKGDAAGVLANSSIDLTTPGTLNEDLAVTGFTFHVSYELTSTTGERITVKDATVFVPAGYCNWKANTHYTYIFKITTKSNGSTDPDQDPNIDPTTDPEVPTVVGLYPIVFDNCTIEDYDTAESEWVITEGTVRNYHNISLNEYSFKSNVEHVLNVGITDGDTHAGHGIDWAGVTVTGPDAADENTWYDATAKTITVPVGAAAGVYTVTYKCPAGDINKNHPATWTQTFLVGNDYEVTTNLTEVGTHGLDAAKLAITTKKDGTSVTAATGQLYIEYPANLTDDGKVKVVGQEVVVANDAKPGAYKLVYKVDEPTETKVDEVVFNVVDYQFSLSKEVVYLAASPVEVTLTDPAGVDGDFTMATATGIELRNAENRLFVGNAAAEGTYTVTYTVQGSNVSKVQYKKTFEVRNSHSVALSATSMDRSTGTHAAGDYSTDVATITTIVNGAATSNLIDKLSIVKADGTATAAGDFKITHTTGNAYTLEVKNTVPAGNYRVKFVIKVAGVDTPAYFDFVVTE